MTEAVLPASIVAAVLVLALALWSRRRASDHLDSSYDESDGERRLHKWGYADTRFEFDGPRSVRVTGTRYPLAGYSLPFFIPFAEEVLGVPITPEEMVPEVERGPLPPGRPCDAFLDACRQQLGEDRVDTGDEARLTHSHGQLSVDEVYRLQYIGGLKRTVDLVLHPQSEEEVADILRLAGVVRDRVLPGQPSATHREHAS